MTGNPGDQETATTDLSEVVVDYTPPGTLTAITTFPTPSKTVSTRSPKFSPRWRQAANAPRRCWAPLGTHCQRPPMRRRSAPARHWTRFPLHPHSKTKPKATTLLPHDGVDEAMWQFHLLGTVEVFEGQEAADAAYEFALKHSDQKVMRNDLHKQILDELPTVVRLTTF